MFSYHLQSSHTWESVRGGGGVDWYRQPAVFKYYPACFPAIPLKTVPSLREFLLLCGGLSAEKKYPGGSYFLRVSPSAGALYPCELYLQARGVEGLEDGVYHFEPLRERVRLLYRLTGDQGLEAAMADRRRVAGIIFLVTALYYRSSWKYGDRAYRYCLLDSGHMLGCIEAAATVQKRPFQLVCRLERETLGRCFGFGRRELVMAAVVSGRREEELVAGLDLSLPFVDGTGFFTENGVIEAAYAASACPAGCRSADGAEVYRCDPDRLRRAILARRSIRSFSGQPISRDEFAEVLRVVYRPLATDCKVLVRTAEVVHRVEEMQPGIHDEYGCCQSGDFREFSGYLCLEQSLGSDGAVTVFWHSNAENYLPMMLKAGILGQRIYLVSTMLGFGCSGIGAFYDHDVEEFLGTSDMILYAMAFGR
ncbi:SagB family peptide dehydrogenase [Desulfolithobacter sp.]